MLCLSFEDIMQAERCGRHQQVKRDSSITDKAVTKESKVVTAIKYVYCCSEGEGSRVVTATTHFVSVVT